MKVILKIAKPFNICKLRIFKPGGAGVAAGPSLSFIFF
jgi:hypothetical protein